MLITANYVFLGGSATVRSVRNSEVSPDNFQSPSYSLHQKKYLKKSYEKIK